MLQSLKWGTFIFFGLLIFLGGRFIWIHMPGTKRLTLEEMGVVFGSVGDAEAVNLPILTGFQCHQVLRSVVGLSTDGRDQQGDWAR